MKKKYYLFKMKTVSLTVISTILLILLIIFVYLIGYAGTFMELFDRYNPIVLLLLFLGYLFLHELLHSLAYVIYGGKYNKITYGIALELGVLYCLCKQNISKNNILHSLMYPLVIIGIVTFIIAIVFNLPLLLWLSVFNLSGCSGDIIMFIFISKIKNMEFSEMDDPISFAIYTNEDVSKISHYGLEFIGTKEKLEREDLTKIKVSKPSYIIMIILFILMILNTYL